MPQVLDLTRAPLPCGAEPPETAVTNSLRVLTLSNRSPREIGDVQPLPGLGWRKNAAYALAGRRTVACGNKRSPALTRAEHGYP